MPRSSFMYLFKKQQLNFMTELDKIRGIYFDRLKKAISADPEKEAREYGEGKWTQIMEQPCGENYPDPSDLAEQVEYESYLYYDLLEKTNYRLLAMWVCCLYETWEQQVLCFIRQEINNGDLYQERLPQKYEGIEKLWKNYGMDIREWNCWSKLNECRLVTNTIKHSEGQSEEALRAVRPELFKFQNSIHNKEIDRLRLYHSTLSEVTLNITEQDLNDYADALIDFWRSIPVDQYMTIIS